MVSADESGLVTPNIYSLTVELPGEEDSWIGLDPECGSDGPAICSRSKPTVTVGEMSSERHCTTASLLPMRPRPKIRFQGTFPVVA